MWLKRALIAGMIVLVIGASVEALGAGQAGNSRVEDIVDLTLLRPLGCLATVAGGCLFVVTLPFTVPTRSVGKAAKRLVVVPFKYTFSRPFPDRNL